MQTLKEEEEWWSLLKIAVGLFVGILSALEIPTKMSRVKIIFTRDFSAQFFEILGNVPKIRLFWVISTA